MANAIAESLKSAINPDTAILSFSQASSQLQQQLQQLGLNDDICVVVPETVEDLATIVKTASEQKWQIIPTGNSSKLDWGGLAKQADLVVSTQKCDRVIDYAVDDLTITVEAGIKLADLQSKLKAHNQFLPIDPAFADEATIGGILATADTGSLRHRYGGIRDLVLGISFVRGDAEIAKAGGKVVKNVAGYDLMKLFIGSYGTLGIISQVTFRTYPIPQASQTVVITGKAKQIEQAIRLLKNSGLTPAAADLITPSVAQKLDISQQPTLLVRFQTIPESIQDQTAQLNSMFDGLDLNITIHPAEQQLWQQLTNLVRIPQTSEAAICKLGILATAAVELVSKLETIESVSYSMIHLGSGLGILQFATASPDIITQVRQLCQNNSGFLSVLSAPPAIKQAVDIWGYNGNALKMMQTIRDKFDPQQIFNRDRFLV